jgi:GxxExxY protein
MNVNEVSGAVIDAAMTVHSALGPGLLENAYEACLLHELTKKSVKALAQVTLPVQYDDLKVDIGYRVDLLVEDQVIVELKAVEKIHPVHVAQLMSYLRLSGRRVGLLINFNVLHLKDGIQRRLVSRICDYTSVQAVRQVYDIGPLAGI